MKSASINFADLDATWKMIVVKAKRVITADANAAKDSSAPHKDAKTLTSVKMEMCALQKWCAKTNREASNAYVLQERWGMPPKAALTPINVSMMHSAPITWLVSLIH